MAICKCDESYKPFILMNSNCLQFFTRGCILDLLWKRNYGQFQLFIHLNLKIKHCHHTLHSLKNLCLNSKRMPVTVN